MSTLFGELQRLYFLSGQQCSRSAFGAGGESVAGALTPAVLAQGLAGELDVGLDLLGADGRVRAMVLGFARAADWPRVADLYQAVQEDLDLPAPALAVSGLDGFGLWFSLAEAVPAEVARAFLEGLRCRYLADMPPARLVFQPDGGESAIVKLTPARQHGSGKWSAFIDPSLGSMFVEEAGLEMAPNTEQQARILAGLASIKPSELLRAGALLQAPAEAADDTPLPGVEPLPSTAARPSSESAKTGARLAVGSGFSDPRSFLLAVMNDPSASARQRIRAAKALLPYFAEGVAK